MSILRMPALGQNHWGLYPSHSKMAVIFPDPKGIKSTQATPGIMPLIAALSLAWILWLA